MKLTAYQLESHLAKKLAPLYLISGDDILLVQETVDRIRAAARLAGFQERLSLSIEPGSDWGKLLYAEAHSLSLFAERRIIECHLAGQKPSGEASKILQDIAANPIADTIVILSTHKLDSKAEKTAWYKAIDKSGVVMPIWPIPIEQLPTWITQRAKKIGLQLTSEAAKLLAEQVEGNLLAAAQELEKIALLQTPGIMDAKAIQTLVTDNARFDIFSLVDCALLGNSKRCLRILETLQAEDTEAILVLWALTREIRTLASLAKQVQQGIPLGSLFSQFRIWEKRQPAVRRFLQHHNLRNCWALLTHGAAIDRILKGAAPGNIWDELQQLTLKMAGNGII